jgi:hypothetical protein
MSSAATSGSGPRVWFEPEERWGNIAGPPEARPPTAWRSTSLSCPTGAQLGEIVQRVRDGRLRTNIGNVSTLDDAVAAFNPTERITGKTIIRVRP